MDKIAEINRLIEEAKAEGLDVSQVRDGYHSFDELYATRMAYNAALANTLSRAGWKVEKSVRHHGDADPIFGGGWFAVTIYHPTEGQITNHYKLPNWHFFNVPTVEELSEPWDGHNTEQANIRLAAI